MKITYDEFIQLKREIESLKKELERCKKNASASAYNATVTLLEDLIKTGNIKITQKVFENISADILETTWKPFED